MRNNAENKRVQTILRTQAGTCLLPCLNYDVAVTWRIPPLNSSSSFEVSVIFGDHNGDDIRRNARYLSTQVAGSNIFLDFRMSHGSVGTYCR